MKVTKKLTGFGWFKLDDTIQTNISRDYLDGESSWDEWAALRECLQNALDEADYMSRQPGESSDPLDYLTVSMRKYKGVRTIVIQDLGRGAPLESILLLGKSGKRGQGYRGEKGEGQLMSFLVLAKLGIAVQMFSAQGWMIEPCFSKYNGGNSEVLTLKLWNQANPENPRRLSQGTVYRIDATDSLAHIINNLEDFFPGVRKSTRKAVQVKDRKYWDGVNKRERARERQVAAETKRKSTTSVKTITRPKKDKAARLFLKGIWVRDLSVESGMPALFNYNLTDVAINRDRDMVDQHQLISRVAIALMLDDVTPAMRKDYWRAAETHSGKSTFIEFMIVPRLQCEATLSAESKYKAWNREFHNVYGKKACLATNPYATSDALSQDYTVVTLNAMATDFAKALGIPTDMVVAGFGNGDVRYVRPTMRENKIIGCCERIGKLLGYESPDVSVSDKVAGHRDPNGFYCGGRIVIMRDRFNAPPADVLATYIHELGHHVTGAQDFTRKFTEFFVYGWTSLLAALGDPETIQKFANVMSELCAL